MSLVVQKYGGSSLRDPERIRAVARGVQRSADQSSLLVVVSAMGSTTDRLIALAREVSRQPEEREIDMLLSTGEQVSASLLTLALHALGCPAISLAGWQAGIETDSHFSEARIRSIRADRIRHELEAGRVVIVTGFQGVGRDTGWTEITTLGRGGSDATAVALAAGLDADRCEIYTDVAGIYSADPRIEPQARKLDQISYEEMLELAQHGAQVMMPRAVELGQLWHVPLEVRSSFQAEPGTKIGGTMEYGARVAGVAHRTGMAKLTMVHLADRPGVAAALFSRLAKSSVHADLIVQNVGRHGHTDLSFAVTNEELPAALIAADDIRQQVGASEVVTTAGLGTVSLVGAGLVTGVGYAATMFTALGEAGINIEMISTSGIRITCVIDETRVADAVRALHTAFSLAEGSEWEATA